MVWNAYVQVVTGWCFLLGLFILVGRILEKPLSHTWAWGWSGLAITLVISILFSKRYWPSKKSVAALMDARLSGGGLIMADEAGGAGTWAPAATQTTLIPQWKGGIPSLIFLASLSFFLLAAYVPLIENKPLLTRTMEIDTLVEEMEQKVELLEEIGMIEEEQAKEWSSLIKALQNESQGTDPAATWEALDQLSNRVEDTAAVEVASRRREVQKREELIAALKTALQAYDENREMADAAMKELSDLLQQAAEKNPHLKDLLAGMSQTGMQPVVASCLTKEEARMLAERLSQMTAEDLERMQQMLQQGMCQSGDCQCPGGEESLKKFLEANPGCTNLMLCAGMTPSGGYGVNRGPGTAPISWLGETSEEGVDFSEQMLPTPKLDSLANSKLVGESTSAPEINPLATHSSGGILVETKSADSAATTHSILPRHRTTVDQFFIRKEEE